MIRNVEDIRRHAEEAGLKIGDIARACEPPMPYVTVYRILCGQRGGRFATVEAISQALDRLLEEKKDDNEAEP